MSMSDPIADMLTRIRNANSAYKTATTMPSSKKLVEIARQLDPPSAQPRQLRRRADVVRDLEEPRDLALRNHALLQRGDQTIEVVILRLSQDRVDGNGQRRRLDAGDAGQGLVQPEQMLVDGGFPAHAHQRAGGRRAAMRSAMERSARGLV